MKRPFLFILFLYSLCLFSCKNSNDNADVSSKPRLIVTTDIGEDPDDQQSLVRLLMYSNEFEIDAIIASATGSLNDPDSVNDQIIKEYILAYGEVLENLRKHSGSYPDVSILLSRLKKGNGNRGLAFIGEGMDSEGSEAIILAVDREDQRKVNLCIWGGQTDLAQALWKVKNSRQQPDYLNFISKLRIYDIEDQDSLYFWIRSNFPELFYILSKAPEGADKTEAAYRGMYYGGDESLTSADWLNTNIKENHGRLGALYPDKTWTSPNINGALKEGDTPSWFYFLKKGLQNPEHPEWGGWGGRFKKDSAFFYSDAEDFAGEKVHARATVYRWRQYFQNDFEARMDWCIMDYSEANHSPVVVISGTRGNEPIIIEVEAGEEVSLSSSGSFDPDGDELDFFWWTYPEAGTNQVCPELENYLSSDVSFMVPLGEEGRDIHMICEVSDNGKPSLTALRRIVFKVKD